jgi:NADPH:quinone reductase-like Zn-dependent oxidoreductase
VTGVTSTRNVDMVRSIGADHVIDYTREDFTTSAEWYDVILDNVGNHSMSATRRALRPTGILISNGGGHANGKLWRTIRTAIVSVFVRQQARPSVKSQNRADLVAIAELVKAGRVSPVIDSTYALDETPQAIARAATGHARGTVVIAIGGAKVGVVAGPPTFTPALAS